MNEDSTRKAMYFWVGLTLVAALVAFSIPLAADATGLLQETGLLRNPKMDDPELLENEPKQQGSEILVASGKTPGGIEYKLTAYQSDRGMCVNFVRSDIPQMESGSCGLGLRGEKNTADSPEHPSLSVAIEGGPDGPSFVSGATTPEIENVEITLKNGQMMSIPTKEAVAKEEAVAALGSDFRFFVAEVPSPPAPSVVSSETELGRWDHSVYTVAALDSRSAKVDLHNFPDLPIDPPVAHETEAGHSNHSH